MAHDIAKVKHLLHKTKHTQNFYDDSNRVVKLYTAPQPGDKARMAPTL